MVDRAGDFGGTWYWNRYPGCMCDVESYTYLPLLEETGYMPTEKYASAVEIFSYAQLVGRHYDLYPHALFHTEVVEAVWDEAALRWRVRTNWGDTLSCRFLDRQHPAGAPGRRICASRVSVHQPLNYDAGGGSGVHGQAIYRGSADRHGALRSRPSPGGESPRSCSCSAHAVGCGSLQRSDRRGLVHLRWRPAGTPSGQNFTKPSPASI